MPFYVFECECGERVEELHKRMRDNPKPETENCPACKKKSLTWVRFPGKSSFITKGTGWSADGYADPY